MYDTGCYSDLPSWYYDKEFVPKYTEEVIRLLLDIPYPSYERWLERVIDIIISGVRNNNPSLTEEEILKL